MNNKILATIILCSVILGGISGWVFTRFVIPKLETIPFLVKYNLAPQSSPLVIHTTQEVRVNEGSDSIAAVQNVKPWLVSLVSGADLAHATLDGAGITLTSDGLIGTIKQNLPADQSQLYAVFYDGTVLPAQVKAQDSESNLAILKVNGNNLATVSFGFPKDLQTGQRMLVLSPSLNEFETHSYASSLASDGNNVNDFQVYSSDASLRTFAIDQLSSAGALNGSAVLSLDANVQGIYDHGEVISADTVKSALNSYFATGNITRPYLGVWYQFVPKSLASLYSGHEGALVKRPDAKTAAVVAGSPAALAGIQEGDLIIDIDGTAVNLDNRLADILGKYTDGQNASVTLIRNKQQQTVTVKIATR